MSIASGITVAIPVRDRLTDLRIAVASVMSQSAPPAELVVVDDASAVPLTIEAIGAVNAPMPVRILRNEVNLGSAASLNRALVAARTPFVSFLDSDDAYAPCHLAQLAERWKTVSSSCACIASPFYWCTDDMRPYRIQKLTQPVSRDTLLREGNIVGGCSVLGVRRDALLAKTGFPDIRGSLDWAMLLRIAEVAPIETTDHPSVFYRSPSATKLSTLTNSFRTQVNALAKLARSLSNSDRRLVTPLLRRHVAFMLAAGGRRRPAWRILIGTARREGRVHRGSVATAIVLVLGYRPYRRFLRDFAYLRAWWRRDSLGKCATRGAAKN